MAATANTPFYNSFLQIGSAFYPVYPNSVQLMCPLNYVLPPILGNFWQWNYYEGLRQPMCECQLAIRDKSTEVFSTTFLNYFMARTTDVSNDTVAISGGVYLWNGRRGFKMVTGVKGDSFSLGASAGGALQFTARFIGTDFLPFSGGEAAAAPTLFTGWDKTNLLSWANLTFPSGALASDVWNFNTSYSNNHSPNLGMNGTTFVSAQNAGSPSAGMSLLVQAATTPDLLPTAANGTFPPPATPTSLAATVTGANVTRVFTLSNPIVNNPNDLAIGAPRVMQPYQFVCPGGDGNSIPPMIIT